MAGTIIDGSEASYSGSWSALGGGFGGLAKYSTTVNNGGVATFDSGAIFSASDTVVIGITWSAAGGVATNTPVSIYQADGTTLVWSGTLNQARLPQGFTDSGATFRFLPPVVTTGTKVIVKITATANGYVLADAVFFNTVHPTAPITSTKTGNRSTAGVWSGNVAPVNGDPIAIADYTQVTWDTSTPIGHSPGNSDATKALTISGTGKIIIADNISLVCRGDVKHTGTGSAFQLGNGSVFEYDSSQATNPSTVHYFTQYDGSNSTTAWMFESAGTGWEIRSNAGGGNGYHEAGNNAFSQGGLVNIQDGTVNRVGYSAKPAFNLGCYSNAGVASAVVRIKNVDFDACAAVSISSVRNSSTIDLSGIRMTNIVTNGSSQKMGIFISATDPAYTPSTPGTWSLSDIAIDGVLQMTVNNFACTDIVYRLLQNADPTMGFNTFTRAMVIDNSNTTAPGLIHRWDGGGTYLAAIVLGTPDNPHFMSFAEDSTVDYVWGEVPSADITISSGDIYPSSGATIRHLIVVPIANGPDAGKSPASVHISPSYAATVAIEKSIFSCNIPEWAIFAGEDVGVYSAHSMTVKSSIFYGSGLGGAVSMFGAADETDIIAAGDFNYNLLSPTLLDGTNGNGLDGITLSSGTLNANGQTATPTFVNSGFNFQTWGATLGADGTPEGAAALLFNDPTLLSDFWTKAIAAWKCTNIEASGTGLAGVDMGWGYVAPASTGSIGIGDLFGNIFGNVFGDLEPPITGY